MPTDIEGIFHKLGKAYKNAATVGYFPEGVIQNAYAFWDR